MLLRMCIRELYAVFRHDMLYALALNLCMTPQFTCWCRVP